MERSISFHGENHGLMVGINNAPIHATFNQPPERPETPPEPLSTVPFNRDPEFVGREELTDEIDKRIVAQVPRTALVGLGGVGQVKRKSQLAIECCYRAREKSPDTWVFWVHASNASRIEQSFETIADRVKIPGRKDPNCNLTWLVCNWLTDTKRKWVLVLDNVDDGQVLYRTSQSDQTGDSAQPFLAHLSQATNGSIIMTTRSKSVALKFVDDRDLLHIEPMASSHAISLLKKKLGHALDDNDERIVTELAEALEFMPLAITQASAFIKQRKPRFSVGQYLDDIRKSDSKRVKLLQYEAGHPHRDWEAKNSILLTWQLSFDYIRENHPSAANILSLMSFFNPHGIPEDILDIDSPSSEDAGITRATILDKARSYYYNALKAFPSLAMNTTPTAERSAIAFDDDTESDEEDEHTSLQDAISVLRDYSFVAISQDPSHLEMHGLVQLATRNWLQAHGEAENWKRKSIESLSGAFPEGEDQIKASLKCRDLLPHVQASLLYRPVQHAALERWARLLYNAATYVTQKGNWLMMHKLASESLKARLKILKQEDSELLSTTELVAVASQILRKIEDAKELIEVVVKARQKVLGAENPLSLFAMQAQALILMDGSQFKEAEAICVNSVEICSKKYGPDDPITLTAIENLGCCLVAQNRLDNVEALYSQALSTRKKLLGKYHPTTLRSMFHLCVLYFVQNRMQEFEALGSEALEGLQSLFGPRNNETIQAKLLVAFACDEMNKLSKADALWKELLIICRESPHLTASSSSKANDQMAVLAARASGLDYVETLLFPIIEGWKTHPTGSVNLGANFLKKYRSTEKVNWMKEVTNWLYHQRQTWDPEHPATYGAMGTLAVTTAFTESPHGRNFSDSPTPDDHDQEAVLLARKAWEGNEKSFGPAHPVTLESLRMLASILFNHERYQECLLTKAYEIHKEHFGDENGHTKYMFLILGTCRDHEMQEAYMGRPLDMELWIESGMDINRRSVAWGRSSISQAAEYGHLDMVNFLLDKGVDPNSRDVNGDHRGQNNTDKTPLMWAAMRGNLETCCLLVQRGADVNLEEMVGKSAISWAAEFGQYRIVEFLLQNGAQIDHQDRFRGQTPLALAAAVRHFDVVKLLLEHGANAALSDHQNRHALSWAAEGGNVDILRLLLNQEGVQIDQQGAAGRTALAWAVAKSHVEIVRLLLDNGADRYIQDRNGHSAHSMALGASNEAVRRLLCQG